MSQSIQTTCCIAGGGPAGMMLGYLLARAGVEVVVLEKHKDFLRDFRGDTIHPSTLEVMYELGVLDEFLKQPHQPTRKLKGYVNGHEVTLADFSHLPTQCKFIALMPQWDFLNFLASKAKAFPSFKLMMQAEARNLIEQDGAMKGVKVKTPEGDLDIHADLVVCADGRRSLLREQAGLKILNLGAPMDVLWMRLSKSTKDPEQTLGLIQDGHILAMLDRGDYWQCAYVIQKGGIDRIKVEGIEAFRMAVIKMAPFLADRVAEIKDWNDVKLLTVAVDRLEQWYKSGLLCIGDCAHAMSPIGGVGINLAIQDAVAAANILAKPLREKVLTQGDLRAVQARRTYPTRMTQGLQLFLQKNVIARVLGDGGSRKLPWQLKVMRAIPFLQRIPARLLGVGFQPEHVRS